MTSRPNEAPLARRVPADVSPDSLLEAFLDFTTERGLDLYPAQEEAILELFSGQSVVLATPTGSGKSLVATALCFKALAEGKRAYYTAPVKALVSEKFFDACRDFGPDHVGMLTGDASVNRDAPILCCTAEILANHALRHEDAGDVDYVVMDEFHYYADEERGWAWQVPLLTLKSTRFLLMSATLGEESRIRAMLETQGDAPPAVITHAERPVPLDYTYAETPLHETIQELSDAGKAPIYIVHFTQRSTAEQAQALTSVEIIEKPQKRQILEELRAFRFDTPFGKELGRFVKHGVGVHHAGMLPKYRLMVEKLAQKGLLRIICGTDTLGVGVNIPIRTVLFTQLCKYDGKKTAVLSVRDFKQIAGRAGRKGYDDRGSVVCQAPEHAIENLVMRRKIGDDPKKLRKARFKKPPERGYAHWDEQTFERLIEGTPERLESRFRVTHGMLLTVLDRQDGAGCAVMKRLIRSSHDPDRLKFAHGRQAIAMFRSLRDAGVIDVDPSGVRVNAELQEDFSLRQGLSLWVLETVSSLDREDPAYPFDVLTLVEATLEDPNAVLIKLLDAKKTAAIAEMKAAGIEYEERMAKLDEIDIDKPNLELILETHEAFCQRHPWVRSQRIMPKSVARELLERGLGFSDYVKEYGLARSEGVLLRYLSDAYKSLVQTVPESAKTEALYDLTDELGALVREVDSSLLDEWERLTDPARVIAAIEAKDEGPPDITKDRRGFVAMIRNLSHRVVRHLALGRYEDAAEAIEAPEGEPAWTAARLEATMAPYFEEHGELRFDQAARAPKLTQIEEGPTRYVVRQILLDPEDTAEWSLVAEIDLGRAREEGRPTLALRTIGPS